MISGDLEVELAACARRKLFEGACGEAGARERQGAGGGEESGGKEAGEVRALGWLSDDGRLSAASRLSLGRLSAASRLPLGCLSA